MKKHHLIDWTSLETSILATGRRPVSMNTAITAYYKRAHEGHAKKSEAYLLQNLDEIDLLNEIRTHISRGNIDEAQTLLNSYQKQNSNLDVEIDVEKCRVLCFLGQWHEAYTLLSDVILQGPVAISLMTLLQMRALALYEMGDFPTALKDIEKIKSLSTLYPFSQSILFSSITKSKIFALQNRWLEARALRRDLWRTFLSQEFNYDNFTSLLRLEIDFCRLQSSDAHKYIQLCLQVTEVSGDDLYYALAYFDQAIANNMDEDHKNGVLFYASKHPRLEKLWKDWSRGHSPGTSFNLIKKTLLTNKKQDYTKIKHVVFIKSSILIDIKQGAMMKFSSKNTASILAQFVDTKQISKEIFFKSLYENMLYSPELHDQVIDTNLYRMRKLGLNIKTVNKMIVLLNTEVVDL